jgi:3-oxoacyl-[acyl-carrier protein] reductase
MNLDFTGKTAIITGAAHGFGRAISVAFARNGAHVWGCDLIDDELRETMRTCVEAGGTCSVRTVDVRDKSASTASLPTRRPRQAEWTFS